MLNATSILEEKFYSLHSISKTTSSIVTTDESISDDMKIEIIKKVGENITNGIPPEHVDFTHWPSGDDDETPKPITKKQKELVAKYVELVVNRPDLCVPGCGSIGDVTRVVDESECKTAWSNGEIIEAILNRVILQNVDEAVRQLTIQAIESGNETVREGCVNDLIKSTVQHRDAVLKNFPFSPTDMLGLDDSEEKSARATVFVKLYKYIDEDVDKSAPGFMTEFKSLTGKALNIGAQEKFGVDSIGKKELSSVYGPYAPGKIAFALSSIVTRQHVINRALREAVRQKPLWFSRLKAHIDKVAPISGEDGSDINAD
jgi:hypothetical protein